MKKSKPLLLAFFLLTVAFTFGLRTLAVTNGDPDRYYHIALSRIMVDSSSFVLRSLPQVEGLGWKENFVDKEFLFHQITALGYRLGAERGVVEASFLCALASLLAFLAFAATRLPPVTAALAALLTFSSPLLIFRMALLRPHVLAILAFVLMNIAILSRRPKLTALAAFAFVLSYHAFYVPMACLIWIGAVSFLETKERAREWQRVALFGLFGCVAGILLNPYFPGNLVLSAIHARIPELMKGELQGLNFGTELSPAVADDYISIFYGAFFVLAAGFFYAGRTMERRARVQLFYLLGVAALFLFLSFKTIRAGEYLFPACGLVIVILLEQQKARARAATAVCGALGLIQLIYLGSLVRDRGLTYDSSRVNYTFHAIAAIPPEKNGAKVFNCEWDRTPYLLYSRPDLRFVDILDPSLLYFANRGAFRGRDDLRKGLVADAYGMIRHAFHSDYVICSDPNVVSQLRDDPSFQQLYPSAIDPNQPATLPSVFRLARESEPAYVRKFSLSVMGRFPLETIAKLKPENQTKVLRAIDLERSSYLNLGPLLAEKAAKEKGLGDGAFQCAVLSPAPAELERLQGAKYLALGGGQGLYVWRNGEQLFRTKTGFPTTRNTQVVVPLGSPLKSTDRLHVLVCSSSAGAYWGLAMSLWSETDLKRVCSWKAEHLPSAALASSWRYEGIHGQTCLGLLAGERIPDSFLPAHK